MMMRALLIGAWLVLLAGAALAQNQVAPTPPPGDNSNRIATTAFVNGAIGGGGGGLINNMPAYTYLCNPTNMNGVPAMACPPINPIPPLFLDTATNNLSLTASSPSLNTYVGAQAGGSGTGTNNSAFGAFSLVNINGGNNNTAFGNATLLNLTTGINNSAFGPNAGAGITTGSGNIAIGASTLGVTTTSSNNVAIGPSALNIATGGSNIGIGDTALLLLTTGNQNIGIGINSGQGLTTGSSNTILGSCNYAATPTVSATLAFCDGNGVLRMDFGKTAAGWTAVGPVVSTTSVQTKQVYSVAGTPLPTCNGAAEGTWAAVSDATGPTYAANYVSGGAVHVPVYCNGTNWITP